VWESAAIGLAITPALHKEDDGAERKMDVSREIELGFFFFARADRTGFRLASC